MDKLDLQVLRSDLLDDCRVAKEVVALARERFGGGTAAAVEACAYQLNRFYNVLEQMALRVAKRFENRISGEEGWHLELMRRLSHEVEGVRPAFVPEAMLDDLRDLRGFRHLVRHAYDLTLDSARVGDVLATAERVAAQSSAMCESFVADVKRGQEWDSE